MTISTQSSSLSAGIENEITLREVESGDLGFIFSTWVNGFHFGNAFDKDEAKQKESMKRHRRGIEYILGFPSVRVAVACLKEARDVIVGFSVFEKKKNGFKLHWVFVKPSWRRVGIGSLLVPNETNEYTHKTILGESLAPKSWAYTPMR